MQEALCLAQNIKIDYKRAQALLTLMPSLDLEEQKNIYQEILRAAHSIEDSEQKTEIQLALIDWFLKIGQWQNVLNIAQVIAQASTDRRFLAETRSKVAFWLAETDHFQEALRFAQSIDNHYLQAHALVHVAEQLAKNGQLEESLHIAQSINDNKLRFETFSNLASYLTTDQLQDVLGMIQIIEDESFQANTLISLIPYLSTKDLKQILPETLPLVQYIEFSYTQQIVLDKLVVHLTALGHLEEAWYAVQSSMAQSIENNYWMVNVNTLLNLLPRLTPKQLEEVLLIVQRFEDSFFRERALVALSSYIPGMEQEKILDKALHTARSIEDEYERILTLADLIPLLVAEKQEILLQEVLLMAQTIDFYETKEVVLKELAEKLEAADLSQAVMRIAQCIEDNNFCGEILNGFVPYFSVEQLQQSLDMARCIENDKCRSKTLATIAVKLAKVNQSQEAMIVVQSIEDHHYCAAALSDLASYLTSSQLRDGLDIAQNIKDNFGRDNVISELASWMAKRGQLQEALHAVQNIEAPHCRAAALSNLAPHLTPSQLQEALDMAQSMDDTFAKETKLIILVFWLAKNGKLQESLHTAQHIENFDSQDTVLSNLAFWLAKEDKLQAALQAVQSMELPTSEVDALLRLLPHLDTAKQEIVLREALAKAQGIETSFNHKRKQVLSDLAPWLLKIPPVELHNMWCKTLIASASRTRPNLLTDLEAFAALISHLGGESSVAETATAIQDVGRWWP